MDPDLPTVKPAWLTTEFWITVIPVVVVLIKLITGKDIHGVDITGLATLAVGISTAAYAISRAWQKKTVIDAQALITNHKLAIARDVAASAEARQHEATMHAERYGTTTQTGDLLERVKALEAVVAKPVARKSTAARRR